MRLSVIAPTYNEAENICPLIEALRTALQGIDYEIVISDDDSPDLTWAIAGEIAQADARIRVLRRNKNRGLGAAVIDAFSCARGEVLACIDGDLQHDPGILPKMLAELEGGADLVVGSRYTAGGGVSSWNWIRRLESQVATKMAQALLGVALCDPMSGYFMLRREDFLRVRGQLNAEGFKILLEIVSRLKPQHVREVPYVFRDRIAGQSKLSGDIVVDYLRQLWRLRRQL
jgi:dolichol-phosphate mannosyltransferase